nr:hypothetical protein [Streptomyces sp. Ru62]
MNSRWRAPRSRTLWARHPVRDKTHGTKRPRHPVVGDLELAYATLLLPVTPTSVPSRTHPPPAPPPRSACASWPPGRPPPRHPPAPTTGPTRHAERPKHTDGPADAGAVHVGHRHRCGRRECQTGPGAGTPPPPGRHRFPGPYRFMRQAPDSLLSCARTRIPPPGPRRRADSGGAARTPGSGGVPSDRATAEVTHHAHHRGERPRPARLLPVRRRRQRRPGIRRLRTDGQAGRRGGARGRGNREKRHARCLPPLLGDARPGVGRRRRRTDQRRGVHRRGARPRAVRRDGRRVRGRPGHHG